MNAFKPWLRADRLIPAYTAILPILSIAAPRGLSLYLAVLALLVTSMLWLQQRRCPLLPKLGWGLGLFWTCTGYFLFSTLWSISTRNVEMARDTVIVVTSASLLFLSLPSWSQQLRQRAVQAFAIGFGLSLLYVGLQELTDFAINRAVSGVKAPVVMKDSNVPKRMGAILLLLVWPVAAYLSTRLSQRYRQAAWLLMIVTIALLPGLYSRAAMVGGLVGFIIWLLSRWQLRSVAAGALLLLPLAIAMTVTGMSLLPWLAPHVAPLLPFSGQERLQIWHDVLQQGIALWPLGAGLDGSRAYTFATHPHNVYLQLFFDGGLFGTLLASLLFGCGWAYARRVIQTLQPYVWGFVGAQFCVLSIAYGIWQAWWLAGNVLAIFILVLVVRDKTCNPCQTHHD